MLEKEYEFYQQNKEQLISDYLNKYIVIKDNSVLGVYDSMDDAVKTSLSKNTLGTFLVKLVEAEEQTVRFYNRVFA